MVNKLDTQWLDDALKSVELSDDYIEDDGFSFGVMQAIAHEETERFLRVRKVIIGVVGFLLAFAVFYMSSGHEISRFIAEPLARYDWTVLLPVGAVFSFVASIICTNALRD